MKLLFEKHKRNPDRTVRCYLTLDCNLNCKFCSAGVPRIASGRKRVSISPEIWAEGLNRRARDTILAGGEPFMYSGFSELISLLDSSYKIEIVTNLCYDVSEFLRSAKRLFSFVISLHPGTDLDVWYQNVQALSGAGHALRFHIVRTPGYEKLVDFLNRSGIVGKYKTALQGDQRVGIKSRGREINAKYPFVTCSTRIYLFGPAGYRYMCVTKLGRGLVKDQVGHISGGDGPGWCLERCTNFGFCVACDNNIEGSVRAV